MSTKTVSKTGFIMLLAIIGTITMVFPQAADALTREWVSRFGGAGNGIDVATAIASDADGNVYVTGYVTNSSGDYDYATIKYNSAGNLEWRRYYDGPGKSYDGATAIAVDNSGNVFVTGESTNTSGNTDYATIKYSTNGAQEWVQRYDGSGKWEDWARAIAVSSSGDVFVTGESLNSENNFDYITIKYNNAGEQQWIRRYTNADNDDGATSIAVDASGNAYVTGYSTNNAKNWDYVTIKYLSNGTVDWARRYNGRGKGFDSAEAIAVDTGGNVYVTGWAWNGKDDDFVTIKYDSAGKVQWGRRYDGPGKRDDWANAIAVDNSGNVIVTGTSYGNSYDYATIKYNSAGTRQWVKRYNGPGKGDDEALGIAVNIAGEVYVTGWSRNSYNADYATIKYSSAGKQEKVQRYNGVGNGNDGALAIAMDEDGNVYVTGVTQISSRNYTYATIKYKK